jgi:hypothetical protein
VKSIRKLKVGENALMTLPDFVSSVFYAKLETVYWANYTGTAFGESKPHTTKEIRKALTWLVDQNGGKVTWGES